MNGMIQRIRRKKAGDFNYVTPILLIVLVGGGWALYAFLPAYYSQIGYDTKLGETLIQHYQLEDTALREKIIEKFQGDDHIHLDEDSIVIERDANPSILKAKLTYKFRIDIPFRKEPHWQTYHLENRKDMSGTDLLR